MPIRTFNEYMRLQFGHDPEVVDDYSPLDSRVLADMRFNSATTLKSWMTPGVLAQQADGEFDHASIRPRP